MAEYLNHVAVEDDYTDALTVGPDFACDHVTITVDSEDATLGAGGNPVLFQLAQGKPGDWKWMDEREFYSEPQSFRVGNVIGARFRNAVAGSKAIIDATLCGPADPDFGSGTPRQFNVSTGINFLGRFTQAQWPPSAPTDGAVAELVDTNNNADWLIQFSSGSGLWTPYNGDTPAVAQAVFLNAAGNGAWAAAGSIIVPVGGTWRLVQIFTLTSGDGGAGALGTAAGNYDDILASFYPGAGDNGAESSIDYAASKGETIYINGYASAHTWNSIFSMYPVSIDNA